MTERKAISQWNFVKIESRGKAIADKFWVEENGVLKLVKLNGSTDQDVMEKLSSDILRQLDLPCVEVELGYDEYTKMNDMLTIVDSFKGQIIEEKRQYIIKYLSTIHTMTKSYMQNKRK